MRVWWKSALVSIVAATCMTAPSVRGQTDRVSPADDGDHTHVLLPPGVSRDYRSPDSGGGVAASSDDLTYHGGPVMRDPTNYIIIWNPPGSTFSATYLQVIEQYFRDNGGTPFMEINSQWGDSSGVAVPSTNHYGGSWVDTANAYPHAGTFADPLTKSDIQDEIDRAITANPTWQGPGLATMYFVYLGKNIIECKGANDCFAGPGVPSAAANYCAYHSYFGGGPRVFATMHYTASSNVCGGFTNYPNGKDQDLVISPTTHEQNEAYSDPKLDAWYNDSTGKENGDNCAYVYGQVEPDGTNLVLNGHRYQAQLEWANDLPGGCIKRLGPASQPTITGDLNFGTVPRGTLASREILIQNTAAGDLNLLNVRLANGAPAAYSIDPSSPLWGTLPPADSVLIKVNYSPSANAASPGPFTTSLKIDTDETGFESQSVAATARIGLPEAVLTPASLNFGTVCVGSFADELLTVTNLGEATLTISNVAIGGGSSPGLSITGPGVPLKLAVGADISFTVHFVPAGPSGGPVSGSVVVTTDDPADPSQSVPITGEVGVPDIHVTGSTDFGDVCRDTFKDLTLVISNSGKCDLTISDITSSSADFQVPNVVSFPLVVGPGDSIKVPIRFAPTTLGIKNGTITIVSDDPDTPNKLVAVSGNVPPGDIRVTGSTNFGDVCGGVQAEKTVSVCNVGKCNLNVSSVAFVPACPDFTLVDNPFPAPVSPDSCESVTIRFTPTTCGAKSCTLQINSDDPDTPTVNLTVTANTPCNDIDVAPDQCFSPTVIQSVGACKSPEPFSISNKGSCPIKIPSIALGGANSGAYSLSGLPSFPINLQPGHTVGDGALNIGFGPLGLGRDTLANVNVTYETDPITHSTATATRILNGEGVRTGARVLVTHNGVAVPLVEKLMIQRSNGNKNKPLLNTVDNAMNLTPKTVTPAAPCGSFQYHREYSTVSNPIQLLPGSYQITATAKIGNKRQTKTIGFDVSTCTFNENIVIELP